MADDTSNRGFASMDETQAQEIRSKGGENSPQNFKKNRKLASEAGKKGGENSHGGGRQQ
jgi:general stress protein YciG